MNQMVQWIEDGACRLEANVVVGRLVSSQEQCMERVLSVVRSQWALFFFFFDGIGSRNRQGQ